jgi:DNA cross-link repair 1C protein
MAQITTDNESVRFHACERFLRCSTVAVDDDSQHRNATSHKGHRVVYVNPVNMSIDGWAEYLVATSTRLEAGEKINNLV